MVWFSYAITLVLQCKSDPFAMLFYLSQPLSRKFYIIGSYDSIAQFCFGDILITVISLSVPILIGGPKVPTPCVT